MDYNRVEVTICGKAYTLKSADSPEYVKEIAKQLDRRLLAFMDSNEGISIITAAVMVSLDILDENKKINSNIDNIRTQIKSYVDEAAQSRMEAEKYKKELEESSQRVRQLEAELGFKNLQKDI